MIVNEVILKSKNEPDVIVVGNDIDLLVLLIANTPEEKNINFLRFGKGNNDKHIFTSLEKLKNEWNR